MGTKCTYSCEPGFLFSGSKTTTCTENGWLVNGLKFPLRTGLDKQCLCLHKRTLKKTINFAFLSCLK